MNKMLKTKMVDKKSLKSTNHQTVASVQEGRNDRPRLHAKHYQ